MQWGEIVAGIDGERAGAPLMRRLAAACVAHSDFSVVEWRRVRFEDGAETEFLVVDVGDGSVAPRNLTGIRRRERLALGYRAGSIFPLEVRALRADFPDTLHQNAVGPNEPRSLCLYDNPWSGVERTWTPEQHLARILWWLRKTADGTLHRSDQPLEPVYYGSPWKVVLPREFVHRVTDTSLTLRIQMVTPPGLPLRVVRGTLVDPAVAKTARAALAVDYLIVSVDAAEPGPIRYFPQNLGAVHDDLVALGSGLIPALQKAIKEVVTTDGVDARTRRATLVIMRIPRLRNGAADSTDTKGLLATSDIGALGMACRALISGNDGRLYVDHLGAALAGPSLTDAIAACRLLHVEPIEVQFEIDAEGARAFSGVPEHGASIRGLILGVGALGSIIADLWAREGWGHWDYVDDDVLLPHNVVRHLGQTAHVGFPKADLAKSMAGFRGLGSVSASKAIRTKFEEVNDLDLSESVKAANVLIDATTTIEVPRDTLDREDVPRLASVFLTPSGLASVLLLEPSDRLVRAAFLEAQYYRAILRSDWGAHHLHGNSAEVRIGGGCRDISTVLSNELVHLHAATLARRLRLSLSTSTDGRICVWDLDDRAGTLIAYEIAISSPRLSQAGDWRIAWDDEVAARLNAFREQHLPSETGGILLGYVDQKLRAIFVVDVLPAPPDSDADKTSFTRGISGLSDALAECQRRTARIVDYIGEWHSHPPGHSAVPSGHDVLLLDHLVNLRVQEGLPALMVIVGHEQISFSFAMATH